MNETSLMKICCSYRLNKLGNGDASMPCSRLFIIVHTNVKVTCYKIYLRGCFKLDRLAWYLA